MEEQTLLDENVMWFKKKIQAFPGRLKITNKHITFVRDIVKTPGGGLIGEGLHKLKRIQLKEGVVLNLPLSEVSFTKGKSMGKKTFLLLVSTTEGQEYKFMFGDELLLQIRDHVPINKS